MRPTIFNMTARRDAAANARALDMLLERIRRTAADVLPDNHAGFDPEAVFLRNTALTSVIPEAV